MRIKAGRILLFVTGLAGLYLGGYYSFRLSPNVVLIIIDTLRADKLGCYGYPEKTSPGLDKLAEQGVRFDNVIAQCSWTRPSIGSMLTSLYPRSLGLYKEKYDVLNDRYTTLAEILKNNGYSTIGITANPHINSTYNFHQGFDEYFDSEVVFKGMTKSGNQKTWSIESPFNCSCVILDKILQRAGRHLINPVFVQINLMDVHEKAFFPEDRHFEFKGPDKKYLRSVKKVSKNIYAFVNELLSMPSWENTLFIITSDHGEGLQDHPGIYGSWTHGYLLYESQLDVPLIFYHPAGNLRAMVVKDRVRLLDLMPTVLDYLDIPVPENIQGRSLKKLLHGGKPDLPEYFVSETNWRKVDKIAVYSDNWKYIENRDNQKELNRYELQPVGVMERGKSTDKIKEEFEVSRKMRDFLVNWERNNPKVTSTQPGEIPPSKEIKQLKSLGYLR